MPLPNFLILGAMKAGTTSLSDALTAHPDVFIPASKEPNALSDAEIESDAGRQRYEDLFERSGDRRALGEASTAYTKRHLAGAAASRRALELLGPELRLIYLVRDPVARAASHARHLITSGRSFDPHQAIGPDDPLCELGCYQYQLEPWVERFGTDHLLVMDMRELVDGWPASGARIAEHIGVDPTLMPSSLSQANASNDARPATGLIGRALGSSAYRTQLQERMPTGVRRTMRRVLIRRAETPDVTASELVIGHAALERWASDKVTFQTAFGTTFSSPELDRRVAEAESSTG